LPALLLHILPFQHCLLISCVSCLPQLKPDPQAALSTGSASTSVANNQRHLNRQF
jgi:hypothetical protein